MAAIHISEDELARDVHAVLERVRQGGEVIVENNFLPVAIVKPVRAKPRLMSEIIKAMEADEVFGVIDNEFATDVETGIAAHGELWNPLSWEQ